jgi:endonuclease-8
VPEGHTVHRAAQDLQPLVGSPLSVSSPQGRFPQAAALDGDVPVAVEAYGKHLLVELESGGVVHIHLGMRGVWLRYPPDVAPMKQVRLRLAGPTVAWDLVAPSTCELLSTDQAAALVAGLGPDPLRPDADRPAALRALAASDGAIGAVLLDQSVVAGVGNVFRAEALHAVGVHPATPARALERPLLDRLWTVLQRMMAQAVVDGRIITVDGPDRLTLPESEARRVYKRSHCKDCGAAVVVGQVGRRTSYHCPVEQPPAT